MKQDIFNIAYNDFFNKWVILKKVKDSKDGLDFFYSITENTTLRDFMKFLEKEKSKYIEEFEKKYNKDSIVSFIDYLYSLNNNFENIKNKREESAKKEEEKYLKLFDITRFDYLYCRGLFYKLLQEENLDEEKLLFYKNSDNKELLDKYKHIFYNYVIEYDLGFDESDFSFVSDYSFVNPLSFPYKDYMLFILFIREITLKLGMEHLKEYYDYIEKNWVDYETYLKQTEKFQQKTEKKFNILFGLLSKFEMMFLSDKDFDGYRDIKIYLDTERKGSFDFYLLFCETMRYLQGFHYIVDTLLVPNFKEKLYETFSEREFAIRDKIIEDNEKKHQEKMKTDPEYKKSYEERQLRNAMGWGASSLGNVLTPEEKYGGYVEKKKSLFSHLFGHK